MNRYMKYALCQVFGTYIPNKYCCYYIIIIILTRVVRAVVKVLVVIKVLFIQLSPYYAT